MQSRNLAATGAIALTICIATLSLVPESTSADESLLGWVVYVTSTPAQKAMHILLYALLAFAWWWTLVLRRVAGATVYVLVVTVLFGAALEWMQTMIPGRFGSPIDIALNAIGSCLGLVGAVIWRRSR